MNGDLLIVNLVDAWLYGSLLAAVAVSLTLVFGLGRVVNFAIGGFYALGAYFADTFRGEIEEVVCRERAQRGLGCRIERCGGIDQYESGSVRSFCQRDELFWREMFRSGRQQNFEAALEKSAFEQSRQGLAALG